MPFFNLYLTILPLFVYLADCHGFNSIDFGNPTWVNATDGRPRLNHEEKSDSPNAIPVAIVGQVWQHALFTHFLMYKALGGVAHTVGLPDPLPSNFGDNCSLIAQRQVPLGCGPTPHPSGPMQVEASKRMTSNKL